MVINQNMNNSATNISGLNDAGGKIKFGTDGVRGRANAGPMTPECVMKIARAAASYCISSAPKPGVSYALSTAPEQKLTVVIGKDTRLSGYMVESALISGFVAMGMDVVLLGPLPTPAVAMLTRSLRADMGVMISASHNPFEDNGIKFFKSDGYKFSTEEESAIEKLAGDYIPLPDSTKIGKAKRLDDAAGRYVEFAKATFPRWQRLDGLKIALDCANGAAYKVAPKVLWELGAEIIPVACEPNGENINLECGATSPALLQKTVMEHKADLGIALDGDGDRLLMVDETGNILDGDQILAMVANSWLESGLLQGGGVVGTVMSNLGLERYLNSKGLALHRSLVGDKFVLDKMKSHKCNLGGEQSGHIILTDYVTTGDGLIAALQVLSLLKNKGGKLSEASHVFDPVPQVTCNIRMPNMLDLNDSFVKDIIKDAENKMMGQGYLLVRASGTEPILRIMAQGDSKQLLDEVVNNLSFAIQNIAQAA